MERSAIHAKLEGIFRNLFDDSSLQISDALTAKDVKNWDSITHIDLMCLIEDEFHIQFTTREVANLANVGELMTIIGQKTAA